MKIGIRYMKADLVIQQILIAIYLFAILTGWFLPGLMMIAVLLQLFIGAWQFFNAIFYIISTQHLLRVYYVIAVLVFFLCVGIGFALLSNHRSPPNQILAIFAGVVAPATFMIWYYFITRNFYRQALQNQEAYVESETTMGDILDSEEIFKSHSNDQ